MASELEALRSVIADEERPLTERKDAAAHAIRLQVAEVATASGDDAEVLELMTPWPDAEMAARFESLTKGRSMGWSKARAIEAVTEQRRQQALLSAVVNVGLSQLERLAACQVVLDEAHPQGIWRMNNYTSEKLLAQVKPDNGTKYISYELGFGPVARPPERLADVWDL